MIRIIDYRTRQVLATIPARDLSKWCNENKALPHSKTARGWLVIR